MKIEIKPNDQLFVIVEVIKGKKCYFGTAENQEEAEERCRTYNEWSKRENRNIRYEYQIYYRKIPKIIDKPKNS